MTVRLLDPARSLVTLPCSIAALAALVLLAGCGSSDAQKGKKGATGPAQVGYVVVQATSVPVTTELPGRTTAFESSDVRPQVSGLIHRRYFTEGALVRKGQPLYQIDPSLYRAATSQAQANLASAAANAEATRIKAERYKPLADMQAVAKQDYTDAAAAARQAAAAVQQNRAALDTARINLRFTTVPAPISGRIGRSLFTEGALVTASQTDPLTTIQRLDPIYVDIQQSSADLLKLRRALSSGDQTASRADVRLTLEDGSTYAMVGSVEFSEVVVDPTTGTVTLRARFPNPQGLLLPGMFVRATLAQSIDTTAYLVPQTAVSRDPKGNATVFIVGPGNKALPRTVKADKTQGIYWIVTDGLNPGDKVITEGIGRLKPNDVVQPVPAGSPQKIGAAGAGGGKGQGGKGKAGGNSDGTGR
jgi:membrane fusion protein (multidrug efflux system)